MKWVESFYTLKNKTRNIMDDTKVTNEIGYFLVEESPAQPEPIQEVVGSQWLRRDGRGRRVPCNQIHSCQVG